jgi:hypothetical protein
MTDFTVIVTSIKQQNKKTGLRRLQSKVTSSGIKAQEPKQNPVLVFSITLTQKRVRPPVSLLQYSCTHTHKQK